MKRYIRSAVVSPQDDDLNTRCETAKTTQRPELIQQCFEDEHYMVRGALIHNPNTPEYMLDDLCSNEYFASQAAVSPRTRPEILRKILQVAKGIGSWWNILVSLAVNPNSPEDVLRWFWNTQYKTSFLVRNPSVPRDILEQSYKSDDSYLRQGVAENPNCPTDILIKLAKDPNADVRSAVVYNKNTPEFVFQMLAADDDEGVAYAARCRLRGVEF